MTAEAAKSRRNCFGIPANIIRPNPDNTPIMYWFAGIVFAAYLIKLRPIWSSLSHDESSLHLLSLKHYQEAH
jgi:hypothetical protein